MNKKRITLEDLALMVGRGFEEVSKNFEDVTHRLDRIENIILTDHRNRLERVEDKIRLLETGYNR